jgi:hypothetical protein
MKKLLLLCAAAMLSVGTISAQGWAWGPKVGATFSTINGIPDAKALPGVSAGLFFESVACNWFVIEGDLLFSMQGFKVQGGDTDASIRINYLSMPVVGKYYVIDGLNLQMGAAFDYRIHTGSTINNESVELDGKFNKFNIQVLTGLAYDFDFGMVLEGRYLYGLTPLLSEADNTYSGMLQISMGWRF